MTKVVLLNRYIDPLPDINNEANTIQFYYDVDPANAPIKIPGVKEGINAWERGISLYQIDYAIIAFGEMIKREIARNPDVIFNSSFQKFMQLVAEFKRIVIESRKDPSGEALPPIGSGSNIPKKYYCGSADGLDDHKFNDDISNELRSFISDGLVDPKIYKRKPDWLALSTQPQPTFEYKYLGFCNCCISTVNLLFTDVIMKVQEAWNKYILSQNQPEISQTVDTIHNKFQKNMAEINNQIINGDYRIKYDTIQTLLLKSVGYMDDLIASTNTELNIVDQSANIDGYYEKINFLNEDIDPALVIPTDKYDLIGEEKIRNEIISSVNKSGKMTTSNVFANTYNISTNLQNLTDVSSLTAGLLDTLDKSSNITSPTQELLDLTMTKIYRNRDGNAVAEYLDESQIDNLKKEQLEDQNAYLYRINEIADIMQNGDILARNRMEAYKTAYPNINYAQSGGDCTAQFQIKDRSVQRISMVQSGGRKIDIDEILNSNRQSSLDLDNIRNQIDTIDKLYEKQNMEYFKNENFLNTKNLQQRNDFLVEMMNIIIVYNFLLGSTTDEHKYFFEQLNTKIKSFKNNLTDMWNIMKSRNDARVDNDEAIGTLLANGELTIDEIKNLLSTVGLAPSAAYIQSDEIINRSDILKIISGLADKYGISNIALISNELYNLYSTKTEITPNDMTVNQLYTKLTSFYSSLVTLSNNLSSEYNSISANASDIDRLREFIGDVLETNLEITNVFIKELISVLQNFGIKTNTIQNIRQEMRNSKMRISDFEIYMKELLNKLKSRQNVIKPEYNAIIGTDPATGGKALINHNMSKIDDFYGNYVTNYSAKISGAANNIIKYFSYEKDLKYIDERENILIRNSIEFNILATGVYVEYPPNGGNPASKLNRMYMTRYQVPAGGFDEDNFFDGLTRRILTYLDNFVELTDTAVGSSSLIPLYADIYNRLPISNLIGNVLDNFSASKPSTIQSMIGYYFVDNNGKWIYDPYYTMGNDELYSIVDNLTNNFKKYISFMQTYRDETANIQMYLATNNLYKTEQWINEIHDKYIRSRNDTDLNSLIKSISNAKDLPLDVNKYLLKLKNYLIDYAVAMGLSTNDVGDMTRFYNQIMEQFNVLTSSIFSLFNEKIQIMYQMMNSLALVNNAYNPKYNQIQQAQKDVSKLSVESTQIKLLNNRVELTNTSNILKPQVTGRAPLPGLVPIIYMTDNDFSVLPGVNPGNLHNLINSSSRDRPFKLQYADKTFFNTIRDEYQKFDKNVTPLIKLMRSMIESGTAINNRGGNITFNSIVTSDNTDLYTNSFIFGGSLIFGPRPPVVPYISVVGKNIGDDYPSGIYIVTYIPAYDHDIIVNNGNRYIYHKYDHGYKIYTQLRDINFIIRNNVVTLSDVDNVIKLLNTGRYLVDFMDKLNDVIPKIRILKPENHDTWSSAANIGNPNYKSRTDKKNDLIQVIKVLEYIENTIRSNPNNYYLSDVLLRIMINGGVNDDSRDLIMNARIIVESRNPDNADFNETIDRIWVFARKLANAWYTIFGHMLSYFILNGQVTNIITFANLIPINQGQLLTLNSYNDPVNNMIKYRDSILTELGTAKNLLLKNREKYPVNITTIPEQPSDFVVYRPVKDRVIFDDFYSNIGNKSENIYVILALIKSSKSEKIKKSLFDISTSTNQLITLLDLTDPFLNKSSINDKINSIHADQYNLYELTLLINNFSKSILSEFKTILVGLGNESIYTEIENSVTDLVDKILTDYLAEYNPNLISNPLTADNRIMDTTIDKPATNKTLHISFRELSFNASWNEPPQIKSDYQFLYDKFINEQTETTTKNFFKLLITDIYGIIFPVILNENYLLMKNINTNLSDTKVKNFSDIKTAFNNFYQSKNISSLYRRAWAPFNIITDVNSDDNALDVKAVIFEGNEYQMEKSKIMDIFDVFKNVTTYVKYNLFDIYQKEIDLHQSIIDTEIKLKNGLRENRKEIHDKRTKLHNIIETISLVMFNEHYKSFAFIDNTKVLDHVSKVVDNYETIWRMIGQKIRDIANKNNNHALIVSQINNYIAFKSTVNKLIKNKSITNNFYKRLSFGIIEYYYDILNSIIYCLETMPYENMSSVQQYLYQFHYVQLKRSYMLFKWLRHEYLPKKQEADNMKRSNPNFKSILEHKIEPLRTRADANLIFTEFQGLRKYLDDYSATVMDKVQLHLRINDFVAKQKNAQLKASARGRDYNFLLDEDPESQEYQKKWESGNLAFTNPNDDNILKVNFDLLDKIQVYDNPGTDTIIPYNILYSDVYDKMEPTFVGIDFQRIYNTKIFPDSDVISNYMSIAPNIITGKGTVIMTYGYSGVGKSVSLFGRDGNPSLGIIPSNGILQATLGYFSDVEIRFRVFEIYGMGTQYNYFWNPENASMDHICFPDITQCVIHHVIDNNNPNHLKSVDRIIFNNKHDIFAYIMDLKDPRQGTKFSINAEDTFNLGGANGASNMAKYFDNTADGYKMRNSSYIEIKHPDQYYNFNTLVGSIDESRKKGLKMKKLLKHVVKQIKPTINNPESSRSILVYDFEINLNPGSENPIFVPFIIYDLPGKEDIYRTYVDSRTMIANTKDSFHDIPNDISKERKSTYVTNPLLIPIFDENAEMIRNILVKLSSNALSLDSYTSMGSAVKFNSEFEKKIVEDIIKYRITTFAYPNDKNNDYTDDAGIYTVGSLYQNPNDITTFYQLFFEDNIRPELYDIENAQNALIVDLGIIGINAAFENASLTKENIVTELRVLICVIVMAFIIKYQLFDLLVEIVNVVVNGPGGSDNVENGGWSRSKIYAFYEAYYINENVVGLLQYLINNVLKKNSTIEKQDTINENIFQTTNKNYKTANRYRAILNLFNISPDEPVGNDYNFRVNVDLLTVNPSDGKSNVLKEMEINEFKNKNQIADDGLFGNDDSIRRDMYHRMADVISFENKGKYDSNKIFRSGDLSFACQVQGDPNGQNIINPRKAIFSGDPDYLAETNRPLLQDFIEPYEQKISFYYVFYVVSNSQMLTKAEQQIKLLNNSMPFIKEMDPTSKKNKCSS